LEIVGPFGPHRICFIPALLSIFLFIFLFYEPLWSSTHK
jgi:hypothetical protein